MADYSVQATGLQAPQASGAQVVQPVETQATKSPVLSILSDVADVFANGLKNNAKAEAEARKNAVVGQYVKEQALINDALAQGLDPASAGARSRASANKYFAGYPEYHKEFKAAGDALKGSTELGEAEDAIKMEKDLFKQRVTRAQSAGYFVDPTATKETIEKQLTAFDTVVRGEAEMRQLYARNAETRAQSSEDRAVQKQQVTETSIRVLNEIAGTNLDATGSWITSLSADVKNGKLTHEQAQLKLTQQFASINATLQSAASVNPELASSYRSIFSDLQKVGMDLIDPKKVVEGQDNLIKEIINRQKLLVLSRPGTATIVASSQLLGANSQIALAAGRDVTNIIASMLKTDGGYVTPVVGSPDEKDTIGFLQKSITSLNTGKFADPAKGKTELTSAVNQVLKQTGQALDQGTSAVKLKDLAAFFASPEYGSFVSSGGIDKQAAQTAKKTFQLMYEPTMIKGIQQKLDGYLSGQAAFGQKLPAPTNVSQVVDIKFTGSGVVFEPKERKGLDPLEQQDAMRAVKDLATTQAAINQLIHIGAHMQGTTDYAKYWEANKHVFLPQMYSAPKVKIDLPLDKPVKRSAAEDGMSEAVKLKPSEEAFAIEQSLRPENIRELQRAIDQARSPEAKQILQEEMNKLQALLAKKGK